MDVSIKVAFSDECALSAVSDFKRSGKEKYCEMYREECRACCAELTPFSLIFFTNAYTLLLLLLLLLPPYLLTSCFLSRCGYSPMILMTNYRINVLVAVQVTWACLIFHSLRFLLASYHPSRLHGDDDDDSRASYDILNLADVANSIP
jgi:hypothetical protein